MQKRVASGPTSKTTAFQAWPYRYMLLHQVYFPTSFLLSILSLHKFALLRIDGPRMKRFGLKGQNFIEMSDAAK